MATVLNMLGITKWDLIISAVIAAVLTALRMLDVMRCEREVSSLCEEYRGQMYIIRLHLYSGEVKVYFSNIPVSVRSLKKCYPYRFVRYELRKRVSE